MIFRKNQVYAREPGGYIRFRSFDNLTLSGFGYGDHIRLRDEYGNTWRGFVENTGGNMVHYVFRDQYGRTISGMSDSNGILLRDDAGRSWRGFIE